MSYPQQPWNSPQQYPHPSQQHGQVGWGGWGGGAVQQVESASERLTFLKKVYGYFAGSVLASAFGAMLALYAGADAARLEYHGTRVPPLVALVAGSPIITLLVMFGVVIGASAVRRKPGINVVALFGMAFILGVLFAPTLFWAQINAGMGASLSANPIRDAFILAVVMFGGLSGYVALSKKDFSYLGSALSMGLFVLIGAALLNIFLGSNVLGLAIASVGLLVFGGFVLYNTSRILRSQDRDAVGGAMQLYLDFLNIFLYLLRILGSSRR